MTNTWTISLFQSQLKLIKVRVKINFDLKNFPKFKDKIIFLWQIINKDINFENHTGGESIIEQHQRNNLINGLNNASSEDLIILSNSDEIPDLKKINTIKSNKKFIAFPKNVHV